MPLMGPFFTPVRNPVRAGVLSLPGGSMSRLIRPALLLSAALLVPSPPLYAQQSSPSLKATASSEAAGTAFRAALFEQQNLGAERARQQLAAALQADPNFALAQIYQSVLAVGLTAADREARIAPLMGALGKATPAEVLLALYWREQAAGRGPAAAPILRAASELVPGDAEIAYAYDNTTRAGKSAAEAAASLKQFLVRFPGHAAAHNQLAYTLWRTGDRDGALASVQQYVKYAPDHPNSHDSYADILLLLGRGAEAVPHVQRELELDPHFGGAHAKLGSIYLTMGRLDDARRHFALALNEATVPAARIDALYWQATADIYARNARSAVQEIMRAAAVAKEANLAGPQALAYDRAAVIDAYMGNRRAVAAHLAAAEAAAANDAQKATYNAHAAMALSRMGRTDEARAAAARSVAPGSSAGISSELTALIALDARDYPAVETALRNLDGVDPLARVIRAELLMRTGKKAEGTALRDEVLATSVKVDGNPPVDFMKVVARMRAASL
jgi:tetratricopeptide (TPR) repeat protein